MAPCRLWFIACVLLLFLEAQGIGQQMARLDLHGDPLPPGAIARLGTARLKHGGPVHAVVYSPDGKLIASAGDNKVIRLWDAATGKELRQLTGHEGGVTCLAFAPKGDVLASGSHDKTIRLFNVASGKELPQVINHLGSVACVAFSPDGKTVASGSSDIHLWDVATSKEIRHWKAHRGDVWSLCFTPDGKRLFSGGIPKLREDRTADADEYTLAVWDVETGKKLMELAGHNEFVRGVAVSPDGKTLASVGGDKEGRGVRLWDTATGKSCAVRDFLFFPESIAFSPDGKLLAVGDHSYIRFIDVSDGKLQRPISDSHDRGAKSVAFSPDGLTLVSAGEDDIGLWDVARRRSRLESDGHIKRITSVAVTPDGKTVVTGSHDGTARSWELATGKPLQTFRHGKWWHPQVSPDGTTLTIGTNLQGISTCDLATGKHVRQIKLDHPNKFMMLAFSPNGKLLVSEGLRDKDLRLWDATTGAEIRTIRKRERCYSVAFSPDGRLIAAVADGLYWWETATGKLVRHVPDAGGPFAFSPDGLLLVTGTYMRVWESTTGKELGKLGEKLLSKAGISFSRSGLLAIVEERRIRVWSLATETEAGSYQDGHSKLTSVAFVDDGRHMVSGAEDGTALVWDTSDLISQRQVLSSENVQALWTAMKDADALKAYSAYRQLHDTPSQTVAFLKKELRPVMANPDHVVQLIEKLDSPGFTIREQATHELEKLGMAAEKALRQALSKSSSLEAKTRLDRLLDKLDASLHSRRSRWAITLLEQIGTTDAKEVLEEIAKGDSGSSQTQEAKAALQRLK